MSCFCVAYLITRPFLLPIRDVFDIFDVDIVNYRESRFTEFFSSFLVTLRSPGTNLDVEETIFWVLFVPSKSSFQYAFSNDKNIDIEMLWTILSADLKIEIKYATTDFDKE